MKIAERLRACVNAAPSNGNVVLTWQTADRLAKALADMDAEQENTRTLDPSIESLQAEVERLLEALEEARNTIILMATVGYDPSRHERGIRAATKIDNTLASLKQPGKTKAPANPLGVG